MIEGILEPGGILSTNLRFGLNLEETSAQHEEISPVNKPDGVTNLSLLRPDAASTISSSSLTSLSDAQWFRTVEDLLSRVDRIQETFKRVHVVPCLQNVCLCSVVVS